MQRNRIDGSLAIVAVVSALSLRPVGAATVAFYQFEGGTNGSPVTSIVDSGPNGLNGDVVGDLKYTSAVAPYSVAGTSALDATADDDFGRVQDNAALHTSAFTVEALVDPRYDTFSGDTVSGGVTIVTKLNTNLSGYNLAAYDLAYVRETGQFYAQVGFNGTGPKPN